MGKPIINPKTGQRIIIDKSQLKKSTDTSSKFRSDNRNIFERTQDNIYNFYQQNKPQLFKDFPITDLPNMPISWLTGHTSPEEGLGMVTPSASFNKEAAAKIFNSLLKSKKLNSKQLYRFISKEPERLLNKDELSLLRKELKNKGILEMQKTPNLPYKKVLKEAIFPYGYDAKNKIQDVKDYILNPKNPNYNPEKLKRIGESSTPTDALFMKIKYGTPRMREFVRRENTLNSPPNRTTTWEYYLGYPQTNNPLYNVSKLSTNKKPVYTLNSNVTKNRLKNRKEENNLIEIFEDYLGNRDNYTPWYIKDNFDINKFPAKTSGFKDATIGHDNFFGTMGGYSLEHKPLPGGRHDFLMSDVWDLHPLQNISNFPSFMRNKKTGRVRSIFEPLKKIEAGKALGVGKPIDVKSGFIYNPKLGKITKTYRDGGELDKLSKISNKQYKHSENYKKYDQLKTNADLRQWGIDYYNDPSVLRKLYNNITFPEVLPFDEEMTKNVASNIQNNLRTVKENLSSPFPSLRGNSAFYTPRNHEIYYDTSLSRKEKKDLFPHEALGHASGAFPMNLKRIESILEGNLADPKDTPSYIQNDFKYLSSPKEIYAAIKRAQYKIINEKGYKYNHNFTDEDVQQYLDRDDMFDDYFRTIKEDKRNQVVKDLLNQVVYNNQPSNQSFPTENNILPKAQNGLQLNNSTNARGLNSEESFPDIKQWHKDWIEKRQHILTPYLERNAKKNQIGSFYNKISLENALKSTFSSINGAKEQAKKNFEFLGAYFPLSGDIIYDSPVYPDVRVHELSHAKGNASNVLGFLQNNDIKKIVKNRERAKKEAPEYIQNHYKYYTSPEEVSAYLDQWRYLNRINPTKQYSIEEISGIVEKAKQERVNKALMNIFVPGANYQYNKGHSVIEDLFTPKEILNLHNTVVMNDKNVNSLPTDRYETNIYKAQNGGYINKFQDGGTKDKKRKLLIFSETGKNFSPTYSFPFRTNLIGNPYLPPEYYLTGDGENYPTPLRKYLDDYKQKFTEWYNTEGQKKVLEELEKEKNYYSIYEKLYEEWQERKRKHEETNYTNDYKNFVLKALPPHTRDYLNKIDSIDSVFFKNYPILNMGLQEFIDNPASAGLPISTPLSPDADAFSKFQDLKQKAYEEYNKEVEEKMLPISKEYFSRTPEISEINNMISNAAINSEHQIREIAERPYKQQISDVNDRILINLNEYLKDPYNRTIAPFLEEAPQSNYFPNWPQFNPENDYVNNFLFHPANPQRKEDKPYDMFVKDAKKLGEWYKKNKGYDYLVVPVYGDSTLVKDNLAKIDSLDDVAIYGHSSDALMGGLKNEDWNRWISEKNPRNCILGTCTGEKVANKLPDVKNMWGTKGISFYGTNPYFKNLQDVLIQNTDIEGVFRTPKKGENWDIYNPRKQNGGQIKSNVQMKNQEQLIDNLINFGNYNKKMKSGGWLDKYNNIAIAQEGVSIRRDDRNWLQRFNDKVYGEYQKHKPQLFKDFPITDIVEPVVSYLTGHSDPDTGLMNILPGTNLSNKYYRRLTEGQMSKALREKGLITPTLKEKGLTVTKSFPKKGQYILELSTDKPVSANPLSISYGKPHPSQTYSFPDVVDLQSGNMKMFRRLNKKLIEVDPKLYGAPSKEALIDKQVIESMSPANGSLPYHHYAGEETLLSPHKIYKGGQNPPQLSLDRDYIYGIEKFKRNKSKIDYADPSRSDEVSSPHIINDYKRPSYINIYDNYYYASTEPSGNRLTPLSKNIQEYVGTFSDEISPQFKSPQMINSVRSYYKNHFGEDVSMLSNEDISKFIQKSYNESGAKGVLYHSTNRPMKEYNPNYPIEERINPGWLGEGTYFTDIPTQNYGLLQEPFIHIGIEKKAIINDIYDPKKPTVRFTSPQIEVDNLLKKISKPIVRANKGGLSYEGNPIAFGIGDNSKLWNEFVRDKKIDAIYSATSTKGAGVNWPEIIIPPSSSVNLRSLYPHPDLIKESLKVGRLNRDWNNPMINYEDGGNIKKSKQLRTEEYGQGGKLKNTTIPSKSERFLRQSWAESSWDLKAKSPKGALGPLQIMPNLYKDYVKATGDKTPYSKVTELPHATKVRNWALDDLANSTFIKDKKQTEAVRLAKQYAAYNWGRGNLVNFLNNLKSQGVDIYNSTEWTKKLPKEPKDYLDKILFMGNEEFEKEFKKAKTSHPNRKYFIDPVHKYGGNLMKRYNAGGPIASEASLNNASGMAAAFSGLNSLAQPLLGQDEYGGKTLGSHLLSGVGAGASAGASLGVPGMIAGALIGGAAGFFGNKREDRLADEALQRQRAGYTSAYANGGKLNIFNSNFYPKTDYLGGAWNSRNMLFSQDNKNFLNMYAMGGNMPTMSRELARGKEVEKEHEPTLNFIKSFYKKKNRFPSLKQVATSIATDHIKDWAKATSKEHPREHSYYKMLVDGKMSEEVSKYAFGGSTHPADVGLVDLESFRNSMLKAGGGPLLTTYDNGGSHDENPYGGIQIGEDALVEQGETRFEDYIFSDRLKAINAPNYKLPKKFKNMTFAKASKNLAREGSERPYDLISKRGQEVMTKRLMEASEEIREQKEAKENMMMALGGRLFGNGGPDLLGDWINNRDIWERTNYATPEAFYNDFNRSSGLTPASILPQGSSLPTPTIRSNNPNSIQNTSPTLKASNNPVAYGDYSGNNLKKGSDWLRYAPVAYNFLAAASLRKPKNVSLPRISGDLSRLGYSPRYMDETRGLGSINTAYRGALASLNDMSGGNAAANRASILGSIPGYLKGREQLYSSINAANTDQWTKAQQMRSELGLRGAMSDQQMAAYEEDINAKNLAGYQNNLYGLLGAGAEGLGGIGSENYWGKIAPRIYGYNQKGQFTGKWGGRIRNIKKRK